MPFKVHYEIFDDTHGAADYKTYDYTMARVEWFDRQRNPRGLMWRQIWHERKKLASGKDYDSGVYREMTRKIRQLEKEIDEYIKQTIKLI